LTAVVQGAIQGAIPPTVGSPPRMSPGLRPPPLFRCEHPERGARAALQLLEDQDRDFAYVVSPNKRFLGVVSADTLRSALDGRSGPLGLQHAFLGDLPSIDADAPVAGLIGTLAQAPCALPVVAADGRFCGAISKTTLLRFLDRDTPPIEPALPHAAPALAAEAH